MPEARRTKNICGKCVVCGDSTVGKSALTQVFCSDGSQYPKTYLMTTGVDVVVKNVNIPDTPDVVEMFFYDMGGKEIYDDVVQHHMANAQMIMFVYDVTSNESFNNIEEWHKKVKSVLGEKQIPSVMVGNKTDLALSGRQVVEEEEGKQFAESLGMQFFQCSAKDGNQVDVPFLHLAAAFYDKEKNKKLV